MASDGSVPDAEYALALANGSNHSTLGEAFFKARITEAHVEDKNNQAVDTIVGDQEDPEVKDKQDVKKADDREIENIKYEEGKNVKDAFETPPVTVTVIEDVRIESVDEDELNRVISALKDGGGEFDGRLDEIKFEFKRGISGQRGVGSVTAWVAEGERMVLCYVQGSGRRKRKKCVGCGSRRQENYGSGRRDCGRIMIWDPGIKIY
ncbi:hypothetical protein Tco_1365100 [Tanacetum coccineum]